MKSQRKWRASAGRRWSRVSGGLSLAVGAIGLLVALPATAAPAPQAIAALLAATVSATGDATLSYDAATAVGETITLTNVKVTSGGGDSTVSVPALVIAGAAERQPGGFTATSITLDGGTATSRGETATWATASAADVVVPSADEARSRAPVRPFAKVALAGLTLSGADLAAPVAVASISADVGDLVGGQPSNILIHANGIKLSTALLTNSVISAFVGMLDYSEVLADVTLDSVYDTTADTVTVRTLSIEAPKIGKITVAAKASGLSLKGLSDPATAKEARANARLDTLSVRVDNAGFVEHMLDAQAEMLGGTRDDVRSQLLDGALPFALSFVKNVTFRDQFQSAMAAFLKDPHSLTVSFAPAAPVPLGQVMRTAAHSPAGLADLLTPTVNANN